MQINFIRLSISSEKIFIIIMMAVFIIFHLILPQYGYHGDEMYYMTIGDNWNIFNFDMPPLSPLFLRFFTFFFGHSVTSVHLASSICCSGILGISCLIALELGGKFYAVILTAILIFFSGIGIFGSIYTYDNPGMLIWVLIFYVIIRVIKSDNQKLLIFAGILTGFAFLNKMSIIFLPFAFILSLVFTEDRKIFREKWIWIALMAVLPFIIPFLKWQINNNWYFLDFASDYTTNRAYHASFLSFLWNQILPNNILSFPFWITGLYLMLFSEKWKKFKILGYMYIILFFTFFILHLPFYFLLPFYAVLFPVAAIYSENIIYKYLSKNNIIFIRILIPVILILSSLPFLPLTLPILPVEKLIEFSQKFGIKTGIKTANYESGLLPQHLADRFGWVQMCNETSKIYNSFSSNEKKDIGIFTGNWSEASAIHVYKDKFGLPEPVSTDGWFYFETLRKQNFKKSYISIGLKKNKLKEIFSIVVQKGIFKNPYCTVNENNQPYYFCSNPKTDLRKRWFIEKNMNPGFKNYIDKHGISLAVKYFYKLKQSDPTLQLFTEKQLNILGYEYLKKSMIDTAIILFKLNTEVFPESSNVYDSYAESLFRKGDYQSSKKNYLKSVELDSSNRNVLLYLKKIDKILGK